MTRKSQIWKAIRYKLEFDGVTYYVQKGSSRYARWYVLDADGKYITKAADGLNSQEAAFGSARIIHERRKNARGLDA